MKILLTFTFILYFSQSALCQQVYLYTETLEFKKKSKNEPVSLYLPETIYPFQTVLKYDFNVEPDTIISNNNVRGDKLNSISVTPIWYDRVFKKKDKIKAKAIIEVRNDLQTEAFKKITDSISVTNNTWDVFPELSAIAKDLKESNSDETLQNTLEYFRDNFEWSDDAETGDEKGCLTSKVCHKTTISMLQATALGINKIDFSYYPTVNTVDPQRISFPMMVFSDKWKVVNFDGSGNFVIDETDQIIVPYTLFNLYNNKSKKKQRKSYRTPSRGNNIPIETTQIESVLTRTPGPRRGTTAKHRSSGPSNIIRSKKSKPKFTRKITVVNLTKTIIEPAMEAYSKEQFDTCEILLDSMATLGIDGFEYAYIRSLLLLKKDDLPKALINIQYASITTKTKTTL